MKSNQRVVYFNGKFVPESEAKISIYDSALMFGDMVFEMTRSFNKKQFKLREHIQRLFNSAKYVQIPMPLTMDEIEEKVYEVIDKNSLCFEKDDEHRIMIDVTRGLLSIYRSVEQGAGTNVIISDFPLRWTVRGMGDLYEKGINLVIPSQRNIPASLLDPKVKNRSRLHYLKANLEVSNYAGQNNWALLLDPDGFVTEGTGCNFFMVRSGVILTPEPRNVLRGISRDYIFELASELGIECLEKNIDPYDVLTADEAFVTGTPFCILPVASLNSIAVGDRTPGKIVRSLLSTWSAKVEVDIIKQIQDWNKKDKISTGVSPYSFKASERK